uniref:Uncharacterized protein n=1 Tax=Anguilla anguilla TaxID=7936 RepID=A0A0E9X8A8_ANGAN
MMHLRLAKHFITILCNVFKGDSLAHSSKIFMLPSFIFPQRFISLNCFYLFWKPY